MIPAVTVAALLGALVMVGAAAAAQGSEWSNAGGDRQNTRNQASEHAISVGNVSGLAVKWSLTTAATSRRHRPSTDTVYVPDWAGNLYAVNRETGAVKWSTSIPARAGFPSTRRARRRP